MVLITYCAGPWYVWLAYSLFILLVFAAIKTINQTLHHLFDTGEVHEVTDTAMAATDGSRNNTTGAIILAELGYESLSGGFELRPMRSSAEQPSKQQQSPPSPILPPLRALRTPPSPPGEAGTRDSSGSVRNRLAGGTRGLVREDSSRFDLKVDVHASKQQLAADGHQQEEGMVDSGEEEGGQQLQQQQDRPSCDDSQSGGGVGNVVIVVGEGMMTGSASGPRHTAHAQTVLEEEAESPCRMRGGGHNNSGSSAYDHHASFSTNSSSQQIACNTTATTTTSSQLTMPGFRRTER